jgi:hypothetical protein
MRRHSSSVFGSRRATLKVSAGSRTLAAALGALAIATLGGCNDHEKGFVDATPPAIPGGVHSITGDHAIYLRWIPDREPDLAGYRIFSNTDGSSKFTMIAEITAIDHLQPGATSAPGDDFVEYADTGLTNGVDYYYAVSAFDHTNNESGLSLDYVVDTPRPEQVQSALKLYDQALSLQNAQFSGYDFSSLSDQAQLYSLSSTDLWFGSELVGAQRVGYFYANPDRVQIQDFGLASFDDLSLAPTSGWSIAGKVEAVVDHTYAIKIFQSPALSGDHNYAKITVVERTPDYVGVYWAYQPVPGLIELSVPSGGKVVPTPEEGSR